MRTGQREHVEPKFLMKRVACAKEKLLCARPPTAVKFQPQASLVFVATWYATGAIFIDQNHETGAL